MIDKIIKLSTAISTKEAQILELQEEIDAHKAELKLLITDEKVISAKIMAEEVINCLATEFVCKGVRPLELSKHMGKDPNTIKTAIDYLIKRGRLIQNKRGWVKLSETPN